MEYFCTPNRFRPFIRASIIALFDKASFGASLVAQCSHLSCISLPFGKELIALRFNIRTVRVHLKSRLFERRLFICTSRIVSYLCNRQRISH